MSWRTCYSAVFTKEAESTEEHFLLVPGRLPASLPGVEQEVRMSYSFLNTSPGAAHCKDR